jgi:hypothetical protein
MAAIARSQVKRVARLLAITSQARPARCNAAVEQSHQLVVDGEDDGARGERAVAQFLRC